MSLPFNGIEDVAPEKLVMDDVDDLLDDYFLDLPGYLESSYLEESAVCQDGDCPPPLFLLPPPPRPPEMGESCSSLSPYESCDNIIIIDSQVQLEETFQNLIIVAVCSAVLVIALVLLVACVWRKRKSSSDGCHCSDGKSTSNGDNTMAVDSLEMKSCGGGNGSEVYDNPNYSHIIIGGKPFFILPTGELSEHVPVPMEGEQLSPRHHGSPLTITGGGGCHNVDIVSPGHHSVNGGVVTGAQQHIYEGGGSSTYRSGSDYETESSTYRPDSDRASNGGGSGNAVTGNGFPPIYEEIDKNTTMANNHHFKESQFGGTPQMPPHHVNGLPMAAAVVSSDNKGFVRTTTIQAVNHLNHNQLHNNPALHSENQSWTSKSLSPRRPPVNGGGRIPNRAPTSESNNSVYYYSDTLRRRPGMQLPASAGGSNASGVDSFISGGRESVQESDSGVSSGRSGHNTSSESTPQPRFELNRSLRGASSGLGPPAIRGNYPVVSSEEDISMDITTANVPQHPSGLRRLPDASSISKKGSLAATSSPPRRQLPTPEHRYPASAGGSSSPRFIPQQLSPIAAIASQSPPWQQQQHPPNSGNSWQQPSAVAIGNNNAVIVPQQIDTEIVVRNTSRREPRAHL